MVSGLVLNDEILPMLGSRFTDNYLCEKPLDKDINGRDKKRLIVLVIVSLELVLEQV